MLLWLHSVFLHDVTSCDKVWIDAMLSWLNINCISVFQQLFGNAPYARIPVLLLWLLHVDNHTLAQNDHSCVRPISAWSITSICRRCQFFGDAWHDVHAHVFGGIQILPGSCSQSLRFFWISCLHTCCNGCASCHSRSWFQCHTLYGPYLVLCFSQLLFLVFWQCFPHLLLRDLWFNAWHALHCMWTLHYHFNEMLKPWGIISRVFDRTTRRSTAKAVGSS